ncbi:hypothetical protein [Actinokineospora diospyrosa]|uniref:FXSXX-COOH protein n=1 Tax=Actinokineospora diospyrosa TaxID=103728 RepID=A0ABT1II26_9PSEU|nr:hypothetical protein [Actinokineospora diospyrosa]MCP2272279.1 hypothetical protein [Actinokineospora diospyrosa]
MPRHATEDVTGPDTAAAKARPAAKPTERPDVTALDIATLQRRIGNAAVAELFAADRVPLQRSTVPAASPPGPATTMRTRSRERRL